jgi:hypothetical protein
MEDQELQATETGAEQSQVTGSTKNYSEDEVQNLLKALKSEREARKTLERQQKDYETQLSKFAQINPDEYQKLQEEAAAAAAAKAAADERTTLLEEKYGSQAAEAAKRAEEAQNRLLDFQKRYQLEKVFVSAGGRTDSADGVSFFDMLVNQIGTQFRLEKDGSITVVDAAGDPVLDKESGKRIAPEDYISSYKTHPIYGTFFKGSKGSGAGIGYGGTDANGVPVEDLDGMSREELFLKAFS